jgi:hypothetical protein
MPALLCGISVSMLIRLSHPILLSVALAILAYAADRAIFNRWNNSNSKSTISTKTRSSQSPLANPSTWALTLIHVGKNLLLF